jgi:hypothetical protein
MIRGIILVLMLAFPALVAADINRLSASPGLERPDAITRVLRTQEPGLNLMPTTRPAWETAFGPPKPSCGEVRTPCPGTALVHLTRRDAQPDCRSAANGPVLWPHEPRADEQKTVLAEQRIKQTRAGNSKPAN